MNKGWQDNIQYVAFDHHIIEKIYPVTNNKMLEDFYTSHLIGQSPMWPMLKSYLISYLYELTSTLNQRGAMA